MGRQIEVETEICIGIPNYPITKPISYGGIVPNGRTLLKVVCVFTVTLRASHLWYLHYSDYQEARHHFIKTMYHLGIGYRKFACQLDDSGYEILSRYEFNNTHVFFVKKEIQ